MDGVTIIFLYIFSFIFGAVVGSFLNVVILRYNTGRTILNRSGCFSCGKTLRARELIPMISFLAQRGHCASCESKISWQYPLVEFISGLIFLAIAWKVVLFGLGFSLVSLLVSFLYVATLSLFLVITVYDLKHTIIPDTFVYAFIVISFVVFLLRFFGIETFVVKDSLLFDFLIGPLCALVFASFWYFSGGRLMGLGDAKIALGMGFLLGASDMVSAVLIAFWGGAIVGIGLLFLRKRYFTMKSEIPFAPFLFLGTVFVFLYNVSFF